MKEYEKYKEVGLPWLKEIPEEWELKPIREIFYERKEINSNLYNYLSNFPYFTGFSACPLVK